MAWMINHIVYFGNHCSKSYAEAREPVRRRIYYERSLVPWSYKHTLCRECPALSGDIQLFEVVDTERGGIYSQEMVVASVYCQRLSPRSDGHV